MSSFRTWQVGGSPGPVQGRLDVCFYSSDERSVEGPVCYWNSLRWPVSLTAHIVCCRGRGYCDWQERDYEIHTPQRDWGKTVLIDAIPVHVFLYTSNFPILAPLLLYHQLCAQKTSPQKSVMLISSSCACYASSRLLRFACIHRHI